MEPLKIINPTFLARSLYTVYDDAFYFSTSLGTWIRDDAAHQLAHLLYTLLSEGTVIDTCL